MGARARMCVRGPRCGVAGFEAPQILWLPAATSFHLPRV